MDAAPTFKKTVLFLSAALAFAAPSFAQPTLQVSSGSVTLSPSGSSQTISVSSSDGTTPLSFTITGGASWYSVSPTSGTTPATLTISTTPSLGQCGAVNCTNVPFTVQGGSAGSQVVNVSYNANASPGGGTISVSPNPVAVPLGSTNTVTLTNNTGSTISYTIGTPSPTGLFLTVPQPGTYSLLGSSTSITVYGSAAGSGNFTITSGSTTLTVTVNVGSGTPTSGGLVASQNPVTLYYPFTGSTSPSFAAVTVSNANGNNSSSFYASVSSQSGGQWLSLANGMSAASALTVGSQQLDLYVNTSVAATLATGSYSATVLLYDATSNSLLGSFTVNLTVNGGSSTTSGVASPSALTFTYPAGSGQPSPQTVIVSGTNAQLVGTNNGTFPANTGISAGAVSSNAVQVVVSGGITTAGTYTGSVTVSSSAGIQTIPVTLTVTPSTTAVFLVSPGDFGCTYTAGQTNACGGILQVIPSDGSATDTFSVTSSAAWVIPSATSGTGRTNMNVAIDPTQLGNGFNNATLTIAPTGGGNTVTSPVTVPVTVLVSGSTSNTGPLTFSPASISVTGSGTTTLNVIGSDVSFTAAVRSGASWLTIGNYNTEAVPSPGTPVPVTVNVVGLTPGNTYTGYIDFNGGTSGGGQTVTVTLALASTSGGNVIVTANNTTLSSTAGLTFTSQSGGSAPGPQSIAIASASGSSGVQFNWSTSASWILVNQMQTGTGATPTSLPVTVNPASLTASATPYTGTITITPAGGTPVTFPVSYTLTPSATISVSPPNLSFAYNAGGSTPAPQSITVSSSDGSTVLNFTAVANSNGNWLQVSQSSGTTPSTLQISLTNLSGLSVNQTYTGTITITGQTSNGAAAGTATVGVNLTVSAPLPTITKLVNAASGNTGAIAAGEIITIFGTSLGPDPGAVMSPSGGFYPTTNPAGNVQVLVSGYSAPLIYVSSGQISAIVPYEINRPVYLQNVNVYVKYLGQTSNAISLAQAASAPGLFTANASGSGPGAILNSDLTPNSTGNPAPAGSTVVLYLTGEGQTQPAGVSGKVTSESAPFTQPVLTPTVTIGGQPAQVKFYAEAPMLVSGVLQINVQIPPGTPSGAQPVVVSLGGNASQMTANGVGAVTVAVK